MPIYEYQCQACGNEHEAIQKMSADPLLVCPACNEPELKKKISAVGFRLKGSGWYETDFKGKSKSESAKSEPAKPAKAHSCSGGGCTAKH